MMALAMPPVAIAAPLRDAFGTVSRQELVRYVHALLLVKQLRADPDRRLASLSRDQKTTFDGRMRNQVDVILAREGLTRTRFNALSSDIEKNLLLRRRVQQIIVEEQIGT